MIAKFFGGVGLNIYIACIFHYIYSYLSYRALCFFFCGAAMGLFSQKSGCDFCLAIISLIELGIMSTPKVLSCDGAEAETLEKTDQLMYSASKKKKVQGDTGLASNVDACFVNMLSKAWAAMLVSLNISNGSPDVVLVSTRMASPTPTLQPIPLHFLQGLGMLCGVTPTNLFTLSAA